MTINQNTVANTSEQGMYVTGAAQRITVTGNRFGTDVDGVTKLPNNVGFATGRPAGGGDAPSEVTFGPGNVVAGNSIDGVRVIDGTAMVVRGNRIGVSADDKPLGNGTVGVNIQADGTLVENNTVSANAQGIAVNGPTDDVVIRANRIGTAPNAEPSAADFGNSGAGVLILGTSTNTRIGGSSSTDGNVISGNGRGVHVAGDANHTTLRQNVIGMNTTVDAPIPNDVGVFLGGGRNTTVGGALGIDARNYIARNHDAGIRINGAKQSVIMGNYITDNNGPGVLADGKGGDAVIGYDAETDGPIEDSHLSRDALQPDREQPGRGRARRRPVARSPSAATACARTPASTSTCRARARAPTTRVTATSGRTRRPASCTSRTRRWPASWIASTPPARRSTSTGSTRRRRSRAARAAASTWAPRSRTGGASGRSRRPGPTPPTAR